MAIRVGVVKLEINRERIKIVFLLIINLIMIISTIVLVLFLKQLIFLQYLFSLYLLVL